MNNAIVATDNTYITRATTGTATASINSLVINGGSLGLAAGTTLTDASGALLFVTNNSVGAPGTTAKLAFGTAEGLVTVDSGVTAVINAGITGTGGLSYNGAGSTLILGGTGTYSGATNVGASATLGIGANNALGTSTVAFGSGAGIQAVDAGNFSVQNTFGPGVTVGGSHNIIFAGNGTAAAFAINLFNNTPAFVTNTGTTTVSGTFALDNAASGANNGNAFFSVGAGTNTGRHRADPGQWHSSNVASGTGGAGADHVHWVERQHHDQSDDKQRLRQRYDDDVEQPQHRLQQHADDRRNRRFGCHHHPVRQEHRVFECRDQPPARGGHRRSNPG